MMNIYGYIFSSSAVTFVFFLHYGFTPFHVVLMPLLLVSGYKFFKSGCFHEVFSKPTEDQSFKEIIDNFITEVHNTQFNEESFSNNYAYVNNCVSLWMSIHMLIIGLLLFIVSILLIIFTSDSTILRIIISLWAIYVLCILVQNDFHVIRIKNKDI